MRTATRGLLWITLFSSFAGFAWAELPTELLRTSPGKGLGEDAHIQARKPVLFYYSAVPHPAFRSAFQRSLRKISDALTEPDPALNDSDRAFLRGVSDFLFQDLENRHAATQTEIKELKAQLCVSKGSLPTDFIVFRNEEIAKRVGDARFNPSVSYELCRREAPIEGARKIEWTIETVASLGIVPSVEDQILTHPMAFYEAIRTLIREFPADQYRYLLMIRGYGDAEHWIKAIYAYDSSKLDAAALRAAFLKRKAELQSDISAVKIDEVLASLLPREVPELKQTPPLGLTKFDALESLAEMGGGDPTLGVFISQLMVNSTLAALEASSELKAYVKPDDYTGLNLLNIQGIRHFGRDGSAGPLPLHRLVKIPSSEKTLESRLNALLDSLVVKGNRP